MSEQINMREVAVQIGMDAEKTKQFSNQMLQSTLRKFQYLSKTDRSFLSRLCEGTMEHQIRIDYIIDCFSKTKVKKCKPFIRNLLRVSVYQICFLDRIPDEAACNEAVKLAKKKGYGGLSGFVNGVLRTISRQKNQIPYPVESEEPLRYLSIVYSMPEWLIAYLLQYYEYDVVKAVCQQAVKEKDTTLRCNTSVWTKGQLKTALKEQQVEVTDGVYTSDTLRIRNYNYIRRLPGFAEGAFVVQDESSVLQGLAAKIEPEMKVLDVCAAPGGKSLHVADLLGKTGMVLSRDLTEDKVELIEENLSRCGFENMKTQIWDATVLDPTLVETMDVVMADVPCSGLGILQRKKDIKYHVTKTQLEELVQLQKRILDTVWNYVVPGGYLIYSTCTLNPKENEEQIREFLEHHPFELESFEDVLPKELHSELTKKGMLQLVQGVHECDGFFICRMKRRTTC